MDSSSSRIPQAQQAAAEGESPECRPHTDDDAPSAGRKLAVFRLDELRFALPVTIVERVLRAAEVTPLPGVPEIVIGAVDVEGTVLPVIDVRRRFLHRSRPITSADYFVLAYSARRLLVLVVDEPLGVVCCTDDLVRLAPNRVEQFEGILRTPDGLIVVQDLARFLSSGEASALAIALLGAGNEHWPAGSPDLDRARPGADEDRNS